MMNKTITDAPPKMAGGLTAAAGKGPQRPRPASRNTAAFSRWRERSLSLVENGLAKALAKKTGGQPPEVARLIEAMGYSLLGGGKRVRPLLALAAAEAVGGRAAKALPAAMAIEMVHAYSLIHDDLPAMDDDDLRRGRPTCHKVFGEATAILAGDALLTLAFETILAGAKDAAGLKLRNQAAVRLATAAGALGMVGGQMLDLAFENKSGKKKKTTADMARDMELRKTGELIAGALTCGGLLGGGGPAAISSLSRLGFSLGLAFQIKDDLLNLHGDAARLGKAVGSDAARGKATLPAIMGEKKAALILTDLTEETLALAGRFGERGRNLTGIIESLTNREH